MRTTAHILANRIWSKMLLFSAGLAVVALTGCGEVGPNAEEDHERREEVVTMVESGQLTERSEYDDIVLPEGYEDLSNTGVIDVREDPFMVFFTTLVGFGPDPYCGYEYSPDPSAVDVDPHNAGIGEAEPLGDGWYWICAR